MIWGNATDMRTAIKRLSHFAEMFRADGPFTSVTPYGRNLALFYDFGGDKGDYVGAFVCCAGAGRILVNRCEREKITDKPENIADIAAWFWRANQHVNWKIA